VSSGNFWVKDMNFFCFWISSIWGGLLIEGLVSHVAIWVGGSRKISGGDSECVTGGSVWSSGKWVGVIVWDCCWFFKSAWSSGPSIVWSIGSTADSSSAVDTVWSVVTVAFWEWSS